MHVKSKKMVQMNLFTKQRDRVTDVENKLMVTEGERPGGINWETGIDIYTLLYIKQIINKDLLNSTGNSTQYSIMTYMGKESKKEWIYGDFPGGPVVKTSPSHAGGVGSIPGRGAKIPHASPRAEKPKHKTEAIL